MQSSRVLRSLCAVLAVTFTASLVAPAVAHADDGMVTITLKNGSRVRGELVEEVPGDHTTIKLATGEVRVIKADEIAPAPLPTPSEPTGSQTSDDVTAHRRAEPAEPPRSSSYEERGTRVHITGGNYVLQRLDVEGAVSVGARSMPVELWRTVCRAPCDTEVSSMGEYRLSGDGHRASGKFSLAGDSTTIDASLGSSGAYVGGIVALGIGGGLALSGLMFVLVSSASQSSLSGDPSVDSQFQSTNSDFRSAGYVMLVGGIVVGVIGIAVLASNTNTVKVDGRDVARSGTISLGSGLALGPRGLQF